MRRGHLLHPQPRYTGRVSEVDFIEGQSVGTVCEGDSVTNRLIHYGCKFEPVGEKEPSPAPSPSEPKAKPKFPARTKLLKPLVTRDV